MPTSAKYTKLVFLQRNTNTEKPVSEKENISRFPFHTLSKDSGFACAFPEFKDFLRYNPP